MTALPAGKRAAVKKTLVLLLTAFFIATRFVSFVFVSGPSMLPYFSNGDIVIYSKTAAAKDIRRGSVAVVKVNRMLLIKRIVAVPGDSVRISDGILFINGMPEEENHPPIEDPGTASETIELGDNEFYILGDNRNDSADSRIFGPILRKQIRGIVIGKFP